MPQRNQDPFANFDRDFNRMRIFGFIFGGFVLTFILVVFCFIGWAITHPDTTARMSGRYVGESMRAADAAYNSQPQR